MMIDKNLGMEWLTNLCNSTVAEGKIPDDWQYVFCYQYLKGKEIQWNAALTEQHS